MANKGYKPKMPAKIVKYSGELSCSEAIYRLALICFNAGDKIKKYMEQGDM
ncbi:MAG TPA: hypothetical protein GXX36_01195 [Clostridiaceae bacterium]|nr:hypothetical protein [Clostridiaceae bacterium]